MPHKLITDKVNIELLPEIQLTNAKAELSKNRGMYFWFDKETHEIVYIGIAVGVGGLRTRVALQHLNPNYLECRTKKHTAKDEFQIRHAIERVSTKDGSVKRGIDKSAFRKSIARKLKMKPGNDTVNYIHEHLYLKVYESEDVPVIKALEINLIGEYQPLFNTAHKSKSV